MEIEPKVELEVYLITTKTFLEELLLLLTDDDIRKACFTLGQLHNLIETKLEDMQDARTIKK